MKDELDIRSFIGTHDDNFYDEGFHSHPAVEVSIVLEGRALFEWTKRSYMEAGHIVIIPSSLPHRFEAVTRVRFGVILLQGAPPNVMELLGKLGCASDTGGAADSQPVFLALSRLDKERLERLFREWLRMKASFLKEKHANYMAWMEVLLLFLLEHSQQDLQGMTVTKAADYMRENLQGSVHISDLAEMAGFTEPAFRRVFEQMYGVSPKQYQQQCRLQEAKWLLSSTDKDIREIAEQIGFYRLHSFSQWFKEQEGIPPTVWRKSERMQNGPV
ncbi:AraC family transcriptional regulator [Paenibacillus sp. HWE-109]|uniref:helix-turn-helix domain-containing protein n=1 Tax=Paenibacillus sp. HWE-109 TaxID=1306526 RepID=UPI001EE05588|nr:AraC family transcriptional regulator [Paenibacillus sp. HWE-109]UKS24686.1 AraC family transcriptional regulator [Paenibacillus sp. HWE-109]